MSKLDSDSGITTFNESESFGEESLGVYNDESEMERLQK